MDGVDAAGSSDSLLERAAEIAQLEAAIARVAPGIGGSAVLVEGSAGIGKTALLEVAADRARAMGLRVLSARGSERESDFGGGLARQLFAPALRGEQGESRARLLSGPAELAGRFVGVLPMATRTEPHLLLHGLFWLTANLAETRPLALVIDDAHWGDEVSVHFLLYLAHRLEAVPVALIVAARTGEPGIATTLVRELGAERGVRLLRPAPLSEDAIAAVVKNSLGTPSEAFVAACQKSSAGRPFLLHELLRAASAQHLAPDDRGAVAVERLIPASVSHTILQRVGRLSPDARGLASAISVLGSDVQLADAAEVAGLDRRQADLAFDELVAAELCADRQPVDVVHPLVRSAIYADLPPSRRATLHSAAATAMQRAGAPADQMAVHLLAVPPGSDPAVVTALVDAAQVASGRGAVRTAVTYLRRALAESTGRSPDAELLLALGTAESRLGDPQAVEHLQSAQDAAANDDVLSSAALALGLALVYSNRFDEAVTAMQTAIDRLATDHPGALMLEGRILAGAILNHQASALLDAHIERARALAEAAEHPPFNLLSVLAEFDAGQGELPATEVATRAERAIVERADDDPTAHSPGEFHAYMALIQCERYSLARRLVAERFAEGTRSGNLPMMTVMSGFAACAALRQGDLRAAEEHARMAIDIDAMHPLPLLTPFGVAQLALTLIEREELDEADDTLARATPDEAPPTIPWAHFLGARGRLRLAQGRFEEALTDALACGDQLRRHRSSGPARHPWRSDAALALHALGRPDEALPLVADELDRARTFGAPRAIGIALRVRGQIGGGEAGLADLADAVDVLTGSEGRLDHAVALVELGAALRRRNRRSEARVPLRDALDRAVHLGAVRVRRQAEVELRATGARPRRLVTSGLDALTASERRIALLAADGRTNREIAQQLFVTASTVEGHLTSVYRKLGIDRRDALAAALAGDWEG